MVKSMLTSICSFLFFICLLKTAHAEERSYAVYSISSSPVIDGYLQDSCWKSLPQTTGFRILGAPQQLTDKQTFFQIGWDKKFLYIGIKCIEPDIDKVKGRGKDGADNLFGEDGIEIFLATEFPDYEQLVISSIGSRWSRKKFYDWKTVVSRDRNSWTVEVSIPFISAFKKEPVDGEKWRFNIARNITVFNSGGDRFTTWAGLLISFHDKGNFGYLQFSSSSLNPEQAEMLTRRTQEEVFMPLLVDTDGLLKKCEKELAEIRKEYPETTKQGSFLRFEKTIVSLKEIMEKDVSHQEFKKYQLKAKTLLKDILKFKLSLLEMKGENLLIVWNKNPLLNFQPQELLSAIESIEELNLSAAINEKEAAVFQITNLSSFFTEVQIVLTDLQGPMKIEKKRIEIRKAVFVQSRGKLYADALPLVDEVSLISVPSYETRQVWVALNTKGLKPGRYTGDIKLIPLNSSTGLSSRTLKLNIHIWPFELPESMPIAVHNFDLDAPMTQVYLEDRLAHRMNVFQTATPDSNSLDFSGIDKWVSMVKGKGFMLFQTFFTQEWFNKTGQAWRDEYEGWFRAFISHLKELGLNYDEFALYIFDEYFGPAFVEVAREIKEIDPKVKIFSDEISPLEDVRTVSPYIDIWCPHADQIGMFPESFQFMKDTAKPIWTYKCKVDFSDTPLDWRLLPWIVFKYDLDGCCYFAYTYCRDWSTGAKSLFNVSEGSYYISKDNGPVPSRRWESWLDGLEDYLYLHLLKEMSIQDKDNRVTMLIEEAIEDVLTSPHPEDEIYKWRERLAQEIIYLQRDK